MKSNSKIKYLIPIFFFLILSFLLYTMAYMTDHTTTKATFSTSTFSADDFNYTLSRTTSDDPSIAGEDIKVEVTEHYTLPADSPLAKSTIRMGVAWKSPDTSVSVFENASAEDNIRIQMDGQELKYTQAAKTNGKYLFDLPAHVLVGSEQTRELIIHVPESLYSTGEFDFTFEGVVIQQVGSGYSDTFDRTELNAEGNLDFVRKIGWAASADPANNGKNLMGYLYIPNEEKPAEYGINFDFEFGATSSGMKNFASKTDAKWSHYADSTVELAFKENILTIGDYAFTDFEKIATVKLPKNLTAVGTYAFDNTAIEKLTLPAAVDTLETMSFCHINELTEITFEGASDKRISFPDKAGETSGAFYVSTITDTIIKGINADVLYYDWKADNRAVTFDDITGIEITKPPAKTEYTVGEDFDNTGMVVSIVTSDGTKIPVTDYTVTDGETLTTDKETVTVSFTAGEQTFTTEVPITVKDILPPKITVTDPASKDINDPTVTSKGLYTVSGTVTDDTAVTSVTVNGKNADLNTDNGKWNAEIELTVDETTTVTVTAQDASGNKSTEVHYLRCEYADFVIDKSNREEIGYSDSVTELNIPDTFYSEKDKVWYRVVGIADADTENDGVFSNCTNLTSVSFPDSMTFIGDYAFSGCTGLIEITLPASVTSIGTGAFPTPYSGYWYNSETKEAYLPAAIPTGVAATYIAKPPVTGIEVTSLPTKTQYKEGEDFDADGMVISKVLANGTREVITDYVIEGGEDLSDGQKVTVTYTENGFTYKVEVPIIIITGPTFGSLNVGDTVTLNVGGIATEFIAVHQGNPDPALYDSSCDGTWLLTKYIYKDGTWSAGSEGYANSGIHTYINGEFLSLFDEDIQSAIKQVKIPYMAGPSTGFTVASGANGLSTKMFLLGAYEVGFTSKTSDYFKEDGACLDYYVGVSTQGSFDNPRIAYHQGESRGYPWWLRVQHTNKSTNAWLVGGTGAKNQKPGSDLYGVRPAFIVPSDYPIPSDSVITSAPANN